MGIAPVYAIPKVLEQVGLSKEDIDVYEVHLVLCTNKSHLIIPTDQRGIRISIHVLRRAAGSAYGKDQPKVSLFEGQRRSAYRTAAVVPSPFPTLWP